VGRNSSRNVREIGNAALWAGYRCSRRFWKGPCGRRHTWARQGLDLARYLVGGVASPPSPAHRRPPRPPTWRAQATSPAISVQTAGRQAARDRCAKRPSPQWRPPPPPSPTTVARAPAATAVTARGEGELGGGRGTSRHNCSDVYQVKCQHKWSFLCHDLTLIDVLAPTYCPG
jgi:hypothetical protein